MGFHASFCLAAGSAIQSRGTSHAEKQVVRWLRASAIAWSIVFVAVGIGAAATIFVSHNSVDFLSFWAAARLVVQGHPAAAYDITNHHLVEATASRITGLLPFPYPPPFLLMTAPLGALSFAAAFALWIAITFALYLFAARLWGGRIGCFFAAAHPAVAANFLIGQNGLLTASMFMAGTAMLARSPWIGGAILGLLVIKPQLALLVPVALIAGRLWSALAAAALSTFAMSILSAFVLGWRTYPGFFAMVPLYNGFLTEGRWPWDELASPFAVLRGLGIGVATASISHGAIAILAATLVWYSWRRNHPHRAAVLASATMLAPPYLLTYDSAFLALTLIALQAERKLLAVVVIWGLSLLPVLGYFGWYSGPNTVPLAAMIAMLSVLGRRQGEHQDNKMLLEKRTPRLPV